MSKDVKVVSKAVEEYMLKQNRPYSVIDVFNNLRGEYGKALIVKSLECLVQSQVLQEKTIGKQKIYFANQAALAVADDDQLKAIDAQVAQLTASVADRSGQLRAVDARVRACRAALPTVELAEAVRRLQSEVTSLRDRLQQLQSSTQKVTPEEKLEVSNVYEIANKEFRKRKRMMSDMLNTIQEHCPKKRQELYEEIGIEPITEVE